MMITEIIGTSVQLSAMEQNVVHSMLCALLFGWWWGRR